VVKAVSKTKPVEKRLKEMFLQDISQVLINKFNVLRHEHEHS